MTRPLSPAAQAVLDAAHDGANAVIFDIGDGSPVPMCAAAALRAVADQVVPDEASLRRGVRPGGTGSIAPDEFKQDQRSETRRRILAIVAELEGGHG